MMNFEWIPFARDLLIRSACSRFKRVEIAGLYLGMSVRALYEARKRLGIVKTAIPEPPTKEQWYQLLNLVPRETVELYLLETNPDDRN